MLPVSLTGVFSDPDGDSLTYTVTTSDASLATATVNVPAIIEVQGVPGKSGTVTVTVTADDGKGGTVSDDFRVTLSALPPLPPLIVIDPSFLNGASFPIVGPGPFSVPLYDAIKDLNGGTVTFSNFQVSGGGVDRVEVVGRDLMVYRGSSPGFATVTFDYTDSLGVKRSHFWSFMVM